MSTATATAQKGNSGFVRARLGSLLAFLPLSVWTVLHVWNNLAAFQGPDAWEKSVTSYSHPVAQLITGLVVLLPLMLHTAWGISRLLTTRPNNVRYGFFANLKYALQRASAVGVLLFLGAHIWLAMLHPRFVEGHPEPFADIAGQMRHHGPTLAVYLLGTLGVSYHLANGVHSFLMGWGAVSSRASLRRLEGAGLVVFFVLLAMSWGAVFGLWNAGA